MYLRRIKAVAEGFAKLKYVRKGPNLRSYTNRDSDWLSIMPIRCSNWQRYLKIDIWFLKGFCFGLMLPLSWHRLHRTLRQSHSYYPYKKVLFSRFNTYFQFLIVKVIFLKSIFKRLLQKSMIQSQNLKILKFVNASKYVTQSCPEPSVRSPTDQAKKVEKASHCTCCGSNRCPVDQWYSSALTNWATSFNILSKAISCLIKSLM